MTRLEILTFGRVDSFASRPIRRVVSIWNTMTGQSSWTLARIAAVTATAAGVIYDMTPTLSILDTVFTTVCFLTLLRLANQWEESLSGSTPAIRLHPQLTQHLGVFHVTRVAVGVVYLPVSLIAGTIYAATGKPLISLALAVTQNACLWVSLYSMTVIAPKRPAREAVKRPGPLRLAYVNPR